MLNPDPAWDAPNLSEHSSQLAKLAPGWLGSQGREPVEAGAGWWAGRDEWGQGGEGGGELTVCLVESLAVVGLDYGRGRERAGERREDRDRGFVEGFQVGNWRAEGIVGDVV